MLTGTFVVGAATSASAGVWHWVGASTLTECNRTRGYFIDQAISTTPCYKDYNRNGTVSYHFYWYQYD